MRVLAIVHQPDAGPGVFAEAIVAAGHELLEWRPDTEPARPALQDFDAAMVFGGAMNVDDESRLSWLAAEKGFLRELVEQGTPALGVCLGAQLLAEAAGGLARRASRPEIGWFEADAPTDHDPLIGPLAPRFEAFGWHSYEFVPPPGADVLATSEVGVQAARLRERVWAIQFHAEVDRPTLKGWIDRYEEDEDAVRIGLDPRALLDESERKLAAWNELGRELCARFLAAAA